METLDTGVVKSDKLEVVKNTTPPIENAQLTPDDMSPEDQARVYDESAKIISGQIATYSVSVTETLKKYHALREELGLPETNDIPPSVGPTILKSEALRGKLSELQQKREKLGEEVAIESQQKKVDSISTETVNTKGEEKTSQPEEKKISSEKTKEEIPEGTLTQLSESLKRKNDLQERVSVLRESPELQAFQEASRVFGEKKKKLEELKNLDNSNNINIGSVSIGGGNTVNVNIEGGATAESSEAKKEMDLAKEAENLLVKMKIDILKLEKEEMEYGPEGLKIKTGELDVETKKIDAETEIWSSGGMDQKKFAENIQKVNDPEKEKEDFKNKELFLKFKEADAEVQSYRSQNLGYYQGVDAKQEEIDSIESSAGNLDCPNQNKILEILRNQNKEEVSSGKENNEKIGR